MYLRPWASLDTSPAHNKGRNICSQPEYRTESSGIVPHILFRHTEVIADIEKEARSFAAYIGSNIVRLSDTTTSFDLLDFSSKDQITFPHN